MKIADGHRHKIMRLIITMPPKAVDRPSRSSPRSSPSSPSSPRYLDQLIQDDVAAIDAVRIAGPGQPYYLSKDSVRRLMDMYAEKRANIRAEAADIAAAAARRVGAPVRQPHRSPLSPTVFIDPYTNVKLTAANVIPLIQTEALYTELKKAKYSDFIDAVDGELWAASTDPKVKPSLMKRLVSTYKKAYRLHNQAPSPPDVRKLINDYVEANDKKITKYAELFMEKAFA